MSTIQNSLVLYDGATAVLKKVNESIRITSQSFQTLGRYAASAMDLQGNQNLKGNLTTTSIQIQHVEKSILFAKQRQDELNKSVDIGKKKAAEYKKIWKNVSAGFDALTTKLGKLVIDTNPMELLTRASDVKNAGNMMQAKTGLNGRNLEMAKQSANNLYADNISKSPQDAANSIASVQQMTGKTGADLEQLTHAGILLQDTFGYGLTDSIKAAGILQQQFGVTGAQAFDLIIQGTQAGLNKNGDFLNIIDENAVKFKNLGLSSQDMFNMMINGAQNGNVSVDALGNAVNAFASRALIGGSDMQEGFAALGLNAGKMQEALGGGGENARQAFQQTISALSSMEDPIARNSTGMKLFGSSFSELGYAGVMALANLNGSVELSTGHLEELNRLKYDNAASAIGSLANTINLGLAGTVGGMVDNISKKITDFTNGLQGKGNEISGIFGGIGLIVGFIGSVISETWSILEPIMWGAIAALIVYNSTAGIGWLTTLKGAAVMAWKTICDWAETAAIIAMIVAQNGLNAAFAACPLTWIIMLIIMIIALFYAAVAVFNKLAGTSVSATGIICAVFMTALAFIGNILMGFVEIVFAIIEYLVNPFIALANFLANLFKDPVGSIIHLFFDMADGVLGAIEKIAKAIDLVFGTNMEATVKVWRENLTTLGDKFAEKHGNGKYEKQYDSLDMNKTLAELDISFEHIGYQDTARNSYEFGASGSNSLKDKFGGLTDIMGDENNPFDPSGFGGDLYNQDNSPGASGISDSISKNTGDTAMNTAAMADTMDVMDEDLKYMRDAAEQEIINRFTLAELKLDVNNNNTIKNVADVDNVLRMLSDTTAEVLCSFAEGVNG